MLWEKVLIIGIIVLIILGCAYFAGYVLGAFDRYLCELSCEQVMLFVK